MATKTPSVSATVRELLTADINLTADQVIDLALRRGLKASRDAIRKSVHNQRNPLKKELAAKKPASNGPSPANTKAPSAPAAFAAPAAAQRTAAPAATAPADLSAVLGNVSLVNKVVGAAGGPEQARQVAEAVRACGGVDAFLKHVETVAGIRGGAA